MVLAGVDHPDHMGVRELGDSSRLAPEALELAAVLGNLLVHQLDRDLALQPLVERPVDGRHATGSEPFLKPVAIVEGGSEQATHRVIS